MNINQHLNTLFQFSMKPIMKSEAKTFGNFLSQDEFEKNQGKIFIITGAVRNLQKELSKISI